MRASRGSWPTQACRLLESPARNGSCSHVAPTMAMAHRLAPYLIAAPLLVGCGESSPRELAGMGSEAGADVDTLLGRDDAGQESAAAADGSTDVVGEPGQSRFAAVDAVAREALATGAAPGFSLTVYDR